MPIRLGLGSGTAIELDATGDLVRHLPLGLDSLIQLPALDFDARVADVPRGSLSAGFHFDTSPSWRITQAVGITLSVGAGATCTLSILQPGDTLYQYEIAGEPGPVSVAVPEGRCYVSIALECSITVDAGAQYSAGNFGVSGDVSTDDRFRFANYHWVPPDTTLRDAVLQAFSRFVLPFQARSIPGMQDGDYVDFEFAGNLALGFGVTYGFTGILLAGRSNGEVKASFDTPIGKLLVSATPSFQVGAAFKLQYSHKDAFRVIAERVAAPGNDGATLLLLRKDGSQLSTSETFGITLNAGAQFQLDAATLRREIGIVADRYLGAAAPALGAPLASAPDSLVGVINSAVNRLLARGDGHRVALEFTQSRTRENTALFIFHFDFKQSGLEAYDAAMRGDYAAAIALPGVELDPRSLVEQIYLESAGLSLELFDLLRYHDITEYIAKNQIVYVGSRTFQIRSTQGIREITGLFDREEEADFYFLAQARSIAASEALSDVDVRLQVIFIDRGNASAFLESRKVLNALAQNDAGAALADYTGRNPDGAIRLTFDAAANLFAALAVDEYVNGRPPAEPHEHDAGNYRQFVAAFQSVEGTPDRITQTFANYFGTYESWLNFNRVKNDREGSAKPGDRRSEGNPAVSQWPEGYPPTDPAARSMVQVHIYAAQHFMNLCEGLKHLASGLPAVDTQEEYDRLLAALGGMVRKEIPFPTYFLKPGLAALMNLTGARLTPEGPLPDPAGSGIFAVTFTASSAASAARQ